MSADINNHVDTNSANFKLGGEELKNEVANKEPVSVDLFKEPSPPLFMGNSSEGKKGNAQDEKDEAEE